MDENNLFSLPKAENIHKAYVFSSSTKYLKAASQAYRFKAWGRNKPAWKFITYSMSLV